MKTGIMKYYILFLVLFFLLGTFGRANGSRNVIQTTVERLFKKIEGMQIKRETAPIPPIIWGKLSGSYESDVKEYFHGSPVETVMRHALSVYDNNMFATAWITSCLLEAHRFGTAPRPSERQIKLSVDFIMDHKDHNLNYSNSIMAFWPQIYDEKYQGYVSTPINLLAMFNTTYDVDWDSVYKELDKLGLHIVVEVIKGLLATRDGYTHAFKIPPDFDDTSVNLGLGSLLKDMIVEFPESNALWQSRNTNLSSVFNALKHFAYKPMSGNDRIDTIDSRTYFYLKRFLEYAQTNGKDVSLVSTWVQDLDTVRYEYYKGIDIPGNVNNVDITVCANAIYAITSSILSGLVTPEVLEDKEIQQLYLNTSTLIAFQINTNFSSHPELALTYYPSVIEFYWFVARTFHQLESRKRINELPHRGYPVTDNAELISRKSSIVHGVNLSDSKNGTIPTLKTEKRKAMVIVMNTLGSVLRGKMTDAVLKEAIKGENGTIYYDDFLGNGDVDINGNPIKYGEDRLFTTSMAINALTTTWTYFDETTKRLRWDPNAPEAVKTTIKGAVSFVNQFILTDVYKPWNAFFSGSFKGQDTYSGQYPANRFEYFNRTKIPDGPHHITGPTIHGMQGVANETWYDEQMKIKHTPVDFHGYNNDPTFFPFWSSEPYTYVTSMLALAKYNNIE